MPDNIPKEMLKQACELVQEAERNVNVKQSGKDAWQGMAKKKQRETEQLQQPWKAPRKAEQSKWLQFMAIFGKAGGSSGSGLPGPGDWKFLSLLWRPLGMWAVSFGHWTKRSGL